MFAPVALFVYNRPDHLMQTLKALEQNEMASESDLYIFADGPKENSSPDLLNRIFKVREIIRQKWNFKNIIIEEKDFNCGLANSTIKGVTKLVNDHGKVIVLEDDLITAQGFLKYMNFALDIYLNEKNVMQISGFQFPLNFSKNTPKTFFLPLSTSWGWATWKRAWDLFDEYANGWEELCINKDLKHKFNLQGTYPYSEMLQSQLEGNSIDSWAIRWWWCVFKHNGLVLYPNVSLIDNIGFDIFATHTTSKNMYHNKILNASLVFDFPESIFFQKEDFDKIILFYKSNINSFSKKNNFLGRFVNILKLKK